ARAQDVATVERQRERATAARAIQRLRRHRDHDVGPELLRLRKGAARERLAGNARREAQIILDARARTGLAAEGARVEHGDREAFGRRIDRGRKSGRAAADDRNVVDLFTSRPADHAYGA